MGSEHWEHKVPNRRTPISSPPRSGWTKPTAPPDPNLHPPGLPPKPGLELPHPDPGMETNLLVNDREIVVGITLGKWSFEIWRTVDQRD